MTAVERNTHHSFSQWYKHATYSQKSCSEKENLVLSSDVINSFCPDKEKEHWKQSDNYVSDNLFLWYAAL